MGFTLLIMVLFPNVTSGKMGFTCWKLEKSFIIANNFISSIDYFLDNMIPKVIIGNLNINSLPNKFDQ